MDIHIKNIIKKNRTLIRQILLYGIIGVISASSDTILFQLLSRVLNHLISNIISVNVGIALSFVLNTFINFKTKDNLFKRGISFFSIGYIGLLISTGILFVGIDLLNYNQLYVKIFSVIVVALIQFILNKLITFKGAEKIKNKGITE